MAAIESVRDVVDVVGMIRGVAAGGAQVGVAEAVGDAVDGHAVFEQRRGPVSPQRVRVCEPLRDAGGQATGPHELVHGLSRQRLRRLGAREAAEADEHGLLVARAATAGQRMHGQPHLQRGLRRLGHRDFRSLPPLPRTNSRRWRALARGRRRSCTTKPRNSADRSPQSPSTRSSA
jgi:hypothetical protein